LNEHLLTLESDYRQLVHEHGQAETALRKAFNANPRQDWVAIRLARTLDAAGRSEESIEILVRSLNENPTSKRLHYELALMYMKKGGNRELISDHLRRSFTSGDQNYDAQFWYAREAFVSGNASEAEERFKSLRNANIPVQLRNVVRGIVIDDSGRAHVYLGDVISKEDAYLFIRSPAFKENIFVHRTRVAEEEWGQFKRGGRVAFTLGFSMRGPTAASIRALS
jgi:tetratricopeptide (TPR) repeat protein